MDLRNPVHRACEQSKTLQCVVLRLHRDEHLTGRHEGVDRHDAQARWAVDEDVVQPLQAGLAASDEVLAQGEAQTRLTLGRVDELDLYRSDIDRGGYAPQGGREPRLHGYVSDWSPLDHDVVERHVLLAMRYTQCRRGIALGVCVDDEHVEPRLGERGGDVDRRRGLADSTLLVRHCDDPGLLGSIQTRGGHLVQRGVIRPKLVEDGRI